MKMIKHSFVRRAVLLLAFVMLFALVAATAVLAGDTDPTVTVTFNSEQCKVYLTYEGLEEPIVMESNKSVSVPYGSKDLTVTVEPELGYELTDIENLDNPGHSLKELYEDCYYNPSFRDSVRADIQCSPKVFNVRFEKVDITKLPYAPASGNKSELEGIKYHYMQPENLTVLPVVVRDGYEFKYWQVIKSDGSEVHTITSKTESGQFYIPYEIINEDMVANGAIYLHAEFGPITQSVIRHDKAYDPIKNTTIKHLGTYSDGKLPMDTLVSALTQMGDDGASDDPENPYLNYKSYIGYKLYAVEDAYPQKWITIPTESNNPNTFERWYTPIPYALVYENLADGTLPEGAPTIYTYDAHTPIQQPTRRGYTFVGWQVTVDGVVVDEQTDPNFILGNQDEGNAKYAAMDEKIVLTAIWQANTYNITYNWNVPADLVESMNGWNATLPKSFTFDQADFFISNPFRKGYTFKGWTLSYTNGGQVFDAENSGLSVEEGKYQLDCSVHAQDITLTAQWEVETYNVTLDGSGATNEFTTAIPGVQYDAELVIPEGFVVPTKKGYTFVGYYDANGTKKYINADGTSVEGLWDLDGENGAVTLYAKWEINYYNIIIEPIQKVPAGVEITVIETATNTRHPYTGEAISLPYQTEFKVEIVMPDGFKIFEWNGIDLSKNVHSGNTFVSDSLQLGAEDMTLTAQACPAAPKVGVGYDIDINITSETEIQVNFANADLADLYEVAIALREDETNLDWKLIASGESYYAFTGLNPGTTYFVFIRLHQTEYTLCGIAAVKDKTTHFIEYVKDVETLLKDMVTNTDGDCVKVLIEQTIKNIYDLIPKDGKLPDNFYETVEGWVAAIEAKLAFARLQDSKIAALETYREECMLSGSFSPEHKALINSLCATAVANISGISIEDENAVATVEQIYNTAKEAIEEIPVTHLYDASGMMQLTTLLGLDQNAGIALNSIQDIKALRRAISDAIAQGKITADSFITIEEAKELLRTLDTISAYSFYLINVQPTEGDTFTFTLTIPEALAGRTGLQVAYYNAATGMVELLQTTVDGNKLIFRAKQVSDFVILADPTVDLTGVIIALGAIVLCQLIAIALVLAARSRAKNAVQHASFVLPTMFLTIHFLPANAELIALGLGIAALILQIVLMWLLISSGMIRVFKTKRRESAERPVTTAVREEDLHADPTAVFDEEVVDEAPVADEEPTYQEEVEPAEPIQEEQPLDEEEFDAELAQEAADEVERERIEAEAYDEEPYEEALAEEDGEADLNDEFLAAEQAFVEADEEFYGDEEQVAEEDLDEEIEEVYDDEEFVEHPTEPYYALDEEEDEYAHTEEETERVSDVDTADQETEETSYGADPLDGVSGEADVQDGDAGDEGGSSSYEEPYGESYEYGDETDSRNAETEDADREETSSEGSVDPTSYLVNNEEVPEDESMYQYDE